MVPRFVLPVWYHIAGLIFVEGGFDPGQAAYETPIGALAFGDVELQVYWHNLRGQVVSSRNTGSWGAPTVIEPIGPSYRLAVLEWDNGKEIRLYTQLFDGTLAEFCSNDGGKTWSVGEFSVQ